MESRGKEESSLEQVQAEHDEHVSKKRRHGFMGAESPDQIQGNKWCSQFEAEDKVASQPPKPCLKPADVMVSVKSVLLLSTKMTSSLEPTIQVWGYIINKLLHRAEATQKIVVLKSDDPWISMAMGYVRQDLDKIKELIGSPVLNKAALVAKIAKSLESWEMLLHGHGVSKEASSLMRELEDLKRNLSDGDAQAAKRSEEERIQGHLTTANDSLRSKTRGLAAIKDHAATLDWEKLVGEAEERKRQRLSKVMELESALRLARSDLSREEEREAKIVSSRARHSDMVSMASEAVTDFAGLLAQTNTCWEAIRGSIQDEGISAELWSQLKFVESCQIEGADEE